MYTVHNRTTDLVDVSQPVEGLRDGWQDRLVGNANLARGKGIRAEGYRMGYLVALRVLLNEFTPPAYQASEPIIRLEAHLREVVARISESGVARHEYLDPEPRQSAD